ncbi:biopolymer transporter ExbD [Leptolyngbya sp. NK1-12]|uniref:Biopolymer transporter ExbD n=1 Tax=Leptolyngbya sp. NK1-12 TaxID=2547451 RepID=A0AA97AEG1_9CYAN|nr:biopolymer transporter ExbD [Leptolyngbya sp. NK1-12]WNZ21990.1 biopolymer transporter ExbD [Leptolyngbya sp. NK1-12]
MRFRNRQADGELPEVNLVPMMDVLMTVLTFFIIVSMTLTGRQITNVTLPQTDGAGVKTENEDKASLVIGLNSENQIVLEDNVIDTNQLSDAMQTFYTEHPDGVVLLKADRDLDYSKVVQLLRTMRDIGGDRVSLAIERQPELD